MESDRDIEYVDSGELLLEEPFHPTKAREITTLLKNDAASSENSRRSLFEEEDDSSDEQVIESFMRGVEHNDPKNYGVKPRQRAAFAEETEAAKKQPTISVDSIDNEDRKQLYRLYKRGVMHDQTRFSGKQLLDPPEFLRRALLSQPDQAFALRPCQSEGIGYMKWLMAQGHAGCFLTDDPGLGKTIQAIGLLLAVPVNKAEKVLGMKHMIVVPSALIQQWYDQFHDYVDTLHHRAPILAVDHPSTTRLHSTAAAFRKADIVLTTYSRIRKEQQNYDDARDDLARRTMTMERRRELREQFLEEGPLRGSKPQSKDFKFTPESPLGSVPWKIIIFDEAHCLQSESSLLFPMCRNLKADFKVAMTGTLLQNTYSGVGSLIKIIELEPLNQPGLFSSMFSDQVAHEPNVTSSKTKLMYHHQDERFRILGTILNAVSVQRLETYSFEGQPVIRLPILQTEKVEVDLDNTTVLDKWYLEGREDVHSDWITETDTQNQVRPYWQGHNVTDGSAYISTGTAFKEATQMFLNMHDARLAAHHPAATYATGSIYTRAERETAANEGGFDALPAGSTEKRREYKTFLEGMSVENRWESTKNKAAINIVRRMLVGKLWQSKIIIFATDVTLLHILEIGLKKEFGEGKFIVLHGGIDVQKRGQMIAEMNANSNCWGALASSGSCSEGLNGLTTVSRVLFYQPDWKPAVQKQALRRAYRFGNPSPVVKCYILTAKDSIDSRVTYKQKVKEQKAAYFSTNHFGGTTYTYIEFWSQLTTYQPVNLSTPILPSLP